MGWGQVYCKNCDKEVSEVDVLRSTDQGLIKYKGCSKCGKNFSRVEVKQPDQPFKPFYEVM